MKLTLLLLVAVTLSAQTRMPRIAVGGIMHESNTFSSDPTDLEEFNRWRGQEVREEFVASSHEGHVLGAVTPETASYDEAAQRLRPRSLSVVRYRLPHFSISQCHIGEFLRFQQIEHKEIRKTLPDRIDRAKPVFVVCAHETLAGAVIDIVHAKGLPCALMLRESPTRQVVTDGYPEELTHQYLDLYRSADLVIPVGRYMRDGLAARDVPNILHIPNLLDTRQFSPGPKDTGPLDRYRIPKDSVVVMHASLMQSRKRPLDLIESAASTLPRIEKLLYLLVGGGDRTAELQQAVQSWGLGDRVRFVPSVPYEQMPAHIRLADMVFLASEGEGIARVYLETQACARVLISSDIPAGCEVIDHGRTGLLFTMGDPSDMAAQVLRAARRPCAPGEDWSRGSGAQGCGAA